VRLVFAGTPEFSIPALDALHAAGHDIVGVYTQPDRPAGRGRKLTASPVAERAETLGLAVYKPEKLRGNDEAQAQLRALDPEVMVVVAYGLILPQAVLDIPRHGCINIHASLLPRWRGAAPIQRAILAGDTETGVTIMGMEAGLDTGPMMLVEAMPISADTTSGQLQQALSLIGGRLIVEALRRLEAGTLVSQPQPLEGVTYASKLTKEEACIDWSRPAVEIGRAVRGYHPAPVAWTRWAGEPLRLHSARPTHVQSAAAPGTVLSVEPQGMAVATGDGVLLLTTLQFPGGRALPAREAVGSRAMVGQVLGS
jgi:methionyl-tRNA formyltransferase